MKKRYIPKTGVKVRDPQTGGHFPAEGAERMVTSYLTRRVNEGDLIIIEPVKVSRAKPKPTTKKDSDSKEGVE